MHILHLASTPILCSCSRGGSEFGRNGKLPDQDERINVFHSDHSHGPDFASPFALLYQIARCAMSSDLQGRWTLRCRPTPGVVKVRDCFTFNTNSSDLHARELQDGEIEGTIKYISIEPAARNWITASNRSYLPSVGIGETMRARAVGVVTRSRCQDFAPGAVCEGLLGWASHFRVCSSEVRRIEACDKKGLVHHIGVFGPTGMTAYIATSVLLSLDSSDVVLVTGAGGAVGGLSCQMAAAQGAQVLAVTSRSERATMLGRRSPLIRPIDVSDARQKVELQSRIRDLGGLTAVIDNVGGQLLDEALLGLRIKGRVVLCGSASTYGGRQHSSKNLFRLLDTSGVMLGFNVDDYSDEFPRARKTIEEWICRGMISPDYDVVKGLKECPAMLDKVLSGHSNGKAIVSLEKLMEPWVQRVVRFTLGEGTPVSLSLLERNAPADVLILFCSGSGFPKELWIPMIERQDNFSSTVLLLDMSCMGESARMNESCLSCESCPLRAL